MAQNFRGLCQPFVDFIDLGPTVTWPCMEEQNCSLWLETKEKETGTWSFPSMAFSLVWSPPVKLHLLRCPKVLSRCPWGASFSHHIMGCFRGRFRGCLGPSLQHGLSYFIDRRRSCFYVPVLAFHSTLAPRHSHMAELYPIKLDERYTSYSLFLPHPKMLCASLYLYAGWIYNIICRSQKARASWSTHGGRSLGRCPGDIVLHIIFWETHFFSFLWWASLSLSIQGKSVTWWHAWLLHASHSEMLCPFKKGRSRKVLRAPLRLLQAL